LLIPHPKPPPPPANPLPPNSMANQRSPEKKLVSGHLFPDEIEALKEIAESRGLTVTGLFRAIALKELRIVDHRPSPSPRREMEMAGF